MKLSKNIQTIHDIDWVELRKRAMAQKSRKQKSSKEWDTRANSFAKRVQHNDYINLVIEHLPLESGTTLLDIGCGPGTLALPIAEKIKQVTALDFSKKMIELLLEQAQHHAIVNIKALQLAWEDDWEAAEIELHELTLASRSTAVEDLPAALKKLNSYATKAVFLTDRISPTPFEPEAFETVDIEFAPGPYYIYTLNILYDMGITADVRILEFDKIKTYNSIGDALEGFLWMFDELEDKQLRRLEKYVESISDKMDDGSIIVNRKTPPRWALLSWQK